MVDWRELAEYRLQIGLVLGLLLLSGWYVRSYRPRHDESLAISQREEILSRERDGLLRSIAEEERLMKDARVLPHRAAPAVASQISPVDRLNYFLGTITEPANNLDLSYFTVTPLPPVAGPGYEELPFTISVAGHYAALADYLYELEYGRDFVVRNLAMQSRGDVLQADFQLSALLLTNPSAERPSARTKDPGRPTSLELARDPFLHPPAKVAIGADGKSYFLNVPAGLALTGVMESRGRRVAIINHEPYGVGDSIANKTITKIDGRGVELSDKVRGYFLEMEQPPHSAGGREATPR